ncbi:Choline/ethanolaminephosphotransferase [Aspergillus caelatus]|uniref:diacylglycerol cholinephosphotransferase n=2 Tax=Aspergillus subgen. Circumdati TaxID=2720871 RepID=A0A5N7A2C4_9EURO|nr:Choline/ethanolaminephosphotransferase [Aspergillus caelatus]KAE8363598.1 Choline/ethanolaminephosphotransferase [Aspergillus caelatus]KAE8416174.1 Choline/ethanolaminephosphotransferase [Aspergillus pseudocaelatus]
MVYIRQHQLPKLREYRYAGVDHSLISRYVLKPFYNNVVIKCFPMSMAPNAITLTGFFFVVINFLTILWYNPTLDQDCPSWVYASCAVGLFLYQTFDGVDGIQARRTKQSGPLGELFDHSVDACNTALGVLIFCAAMNFGQSWATVVTLWGSTMTFYVQTWDEYYTQVLTLGIISGPVEGVLTLCLVFGLTAYMGGGSFWHQSMLETVGVPKLDAIPEQLYDMPFTQWYLVYGAIVLFFATGSSIVHVMQIRRERGQDPIAPLFGLLPLVAVWVFVPAYLYLQPTILENHMVPFALYVGLVNAYAVGRMITAHLVKASFPYFNVLLCPLALAVLDSAGPAFGLWRSALGGGDGQIAFMYTCLGLAIGVYGSFIFDIITTICDYIDIWCLTIKHPYVEKQTANGQVDAVEKKMS